MSLSSILHVHACRICEQPMEFVSEEIVHAKPVEVFHCPTCDKYEAAQAGATGAETNIAPSVAVSH